MPVRGEIGRNGEYDSARSSRSDGSMMFITASKRSNTRMSAASNIPDV